nr:DUF4158 domain-containing protein [Rhodococcus pyridinivorans]
MFADEELERLRGFPEISREELFRYFTLTPADLAFVDPGRAGAQPSGWAWRSRCVRCRGWDSCRIGWSRLRRWRWLVSPSSCGWIRW